MATAKAPNSIKETSGGARAYATHWIVYEQTVKGLQYISCMSTVVVGVLTVIGSLHSSWGGGNESFKLQLQYIVE